MRCLAMTVVGAAACTLAASMPAAADRLGSRAVALRAPSVMAPRLHDMAPPGSIVLIEGVVGASPAYGCGVIVADHGSSITIVTASHNLVIERRTLITVTGERLRLRTTTTVAGHDLALIEADRPGGTYAVARLAPEPSAGSRVRVWGPIADRPFTLHDGIVRPLDPRVTDVPEGAFAIDCADCDHGDSGTGIFDDRGRLLGVVTSAYFEKRRKLFVLAERVVPSARQEELPVAAP